MENIINIYCSGTNQSQIFKIPYKNINTIDGYLYFRITSKESIFNIQYDIYCIYKDNTFVFNSIEMYVESDDITGKLEELKIELSEYLKHYFKTKSITMMSYKEKTEFNFRHNICIDEKANLYFAFYKKFMHKSIICVDNYKFVYKQTNYKSTKILDDILKLKPNMLFYATILPILPLDIINLILKSNIDEHYSIFFYYRAYTLLYKKYPKLSFIYISNLIDKSRLSLNFELIDHFKNILFGLVRLNNWYNTFQLLFTLNHKDDVSVSHLYISSNIKKNRLIQNINISIAPGNKIFREDTKVLCKDNFIYISDCILVKTSSPIYINTIIIEVIGVEYNIPIYKKIRSSDKVLLDLSRFNNEDELNIKKIILDNNTINVDYKFVYIKRSHDLKFQLFLDGYYKTYKFNESSNFIYDRSKEIKDGYFIIKIKREENTKMIIRITDLYLEEILL